MQVDDGRGLGQVGAQQQLLGVLREVDVPRGGGEVVRLQLVEGFERVPQSHRVVHGAWGGTAFVSHRIQTHLELEDAFIYSDLQ